MGHRTNFDGRRFPLPHLRSEMWGTHVYEWAKIGTTCEAQVPRLRSLRRPSLGITPLYISL